MNKSMKPGAVAQRPLTEEEKKSQIMRAFMQKKASLEMNSCGLSTDRR